MSPSRLTTSGACAALALLLALPAPAQEPSPATAAPVAEAETEPAAEARLLATLETALESGPGARPLRSRLAAQAAGHRVEAGAGAPTAGWLREGIGPSFDERPNAIDHLLFSLPFNGPGQLSRARELAQEASRWQQAALRAGLAEEALAAGGTWLELAAEIERGELARRRLEHIEGPSAATVRARRWRASSSCSGGPRAKTW